MKKEYHLVSPVEETHFLSVYSLVRRIVGYHLGNRFPDAVEDVTQHSMVKLWQWRTRRVVVNQNSDIEKEGKAVELLPEDWQRIAGRTAVNEVKTFYTAKHQREVPLTAEIISGESCPADIARQLPTFIIEGNTDYETESQLSEIWKSFLNLSLREKYALILKRRIFCNWLVASGNCKTKEIAAALEVSPQEFIEIYKRLPIDDEEIAHLLERKLLEKVAPAKVVKARQRAKAKLRNALLSGDCHGKAYYKGKT